MANKERLYKKYEAQHKARLLKYGNEIDRIYYEAIDAIALSAEGTTLLPGTFDLKKYPSLNRKVKSVLEKLSSNIEVFLYSSIAKEWVAADIKNDEIFDILLGRKGKKSSLLNMRSEDALNAFLERKDKNGLNLSKRVYKQVGAYKNELEAGLADGIAWGKGHKELGRDLKKYLKEPDKVFRKIKSEGKVRLSKPALAYKPGQGVYRSSNKNIQRLTRTETNMGYRKSDMIRYQRSPFVIGFEVKLSAAHPRYDICDNLAGPYPVTFIFVGWHPQCICFNIPILLTPAEYDRMENDLLDGKDISKIKYTDRPTPNADQAKKWWSENKDVVNNWASTPYFIKDNPSFFKN